MEDVRSCCVCDSTCSHHHHDDPKPEPHSVRRWAPTPPEELVFTISYMMGMSLWQLPMEYIDGNPVPTVIFRGQPTTFHVMVMGICVAFCGSVGAIELRQGNPKLARCYRVFAFCGMAVTVAALLWAAVPAGFSWVASLVW